MSRDGLRIYWGASKAEIAGGICESEQDLRRWLHAREGTCGA